MPKLREFYEDLRTLEIEMECLKNAIEYLGNADDLLFSRIILQKEYESRRTVLNNRLNKEYVFNPKSNTINIDD